MLYGESKNSFGISVFHLTFLVYFRVNFSENDELFFLFKFACSDHVKLEGMYTFECFNCQEPTRIQQESAYESGGRAGTQGASYERIIAAGVLGKAGVLGG